MRKILVVPILALFACGGSQTFKDQARDAMPSKDTVQMGSPQASSQASRSKDTGSLEQDSTAGEHSPFFDLTVGVAFTFAAGVFGLARAPDVALPRDPDARLRAGAADRFAPVCARFGFGAWAIAVQTPLEVRGPAGRNCTRTSSAIEVSRELLRHIPGPGPGV